MAVRGSALGVALAGFMVCPSAFALNPALDVSQYAHNSWKNSDGFAKGRIFAIAQTPDGYFWLGTEFGLVRFDGVRSVPWAPPAGAELPSKIITSLLVSRNGTLWIGTFKGLAGWKDGRLTRYPELAAVIALVEDSDGTVWAGGAGTPNGRLCAIEHDKVQCDGEDGRFGLGVLSLYEHSGSLWAGSMAGLWRWKPDPPKLFPIPGPAPEIPSLIEGDNGSLWIAKRGGIRQLVNGKVEAYPLLAGAEFNPGRLLRDRDGGLWVGTSSQGLVHVHQGGTDVYASADGLSGNVVSALFEDREGNIWVSTFDGFDRFREYAVPATSSKQGLSNSQILSVLADRDGGVWLSTPDGLNRWHGGQITVFRRPGARLHTGPGPQPTVREISDNGLPDNAQQSLFQDSRGRIWVSTPRGIAYFEDDRFVPVGGPSTIVHSILEDRAGDLWINDQSLGLFHLRDGKLVERIPWAKLGRRDNATVLAADRVQGGLWLGFSQGDVAYFKDGQVRVSYSAGDGLGAGRVNDVRVDGDETLWAATEGGISRLKKGRIATLTSRNGLPCDAVQWTIEDDARSVWLNMPCGLVSIARTELEAWVADPNHEIKAKVFDNSDGVRSRANANNFTPPVAKSSDGKLWFVISGGVSVIDPRHLPFNKLPPPVSIEQITADRKPATPDAHGRLRLPPLIRELQIDYTALSFVAPEKVRFRYKLEGHDREWADAGTRRQAFYNDLSPRNYRFRVMAANNSGVWNEAGASLDFLVAPTYYQTTWFRALVVAAVLALLVGLYRLRLLYLTKQFNARLEGRVSERTRVARDLHDTLLQSFQGVLLKFSTVKYVIRSRPPDEAEEALDRVIDQARAAVTEGRDAVQGLRSSIAVANDLGRAITTFAEGLAVDHTGANCPEFRVYVEGKSRELPPLVRDEVYKIACECLRNAFRHAQAKRIEVQVRYDPRQFWLQILDNGKGIDPAVLSAGGRAGHHGLPGLHERAELTGGKLSVRSQVNSGTEIELSIPGSIAYLKPTHPGGAMAAAETTGGKTGGTKETG